MRNTLKKLGVSLLIATMLIVPATTSVSAHGMHHYNNTTAHHRNRITKHYTCNGHESHTHQNGICPYTSGTIVKDVQESLNKLGYHCGTADGVIGKKTKAAIKKFQKDNHCTVNGKITPDVLEQLSL